MRLPRQIEELIPPGARLKRCTKTKHFITYVFEHCCGPYLVDNDRLTIKLSRSGNPANSIVERRWSDDVVPPPSTPPKIGKKDKAVLIDPSDPFYIWHEGKKPAPRAPCLIKNNQIFDLDGNLLGECLPPPR